MVGKTPCIIDPNTLKTSPANQRIINSNDNPSLLFLLKFSYICGANTIIQQAKEMDPVIPLTAWASMIIGGGGAISNECNTTTCG
jgi:hypothetical protein